MVEQAKYLTKDIYEIAAIEFISEITPDEILVELNSKLGVAVYNDKSKLPTPDLLKEFMEFKNYYIRMKRKIFETVDNAIEEAKNATKTN